MRLGSGAQLFTVLLADRFLRHFWNGPGLALNALASGDHWRAVSYSTSLFDSFNTVLPEFRDVCLFADEYVRLKRAPAVDVAASRSHAEVRLSLNIHSHFSSNEEIRTPNVENGNRVVGFALPLKHIIEALKHLCLLILVNTVLEQLGDCETEFTSDVVNALADDVVGQGDHCYIEGYHHALLQLSTPGLNYDLCGIGVSNKVKFS